MARLVKDAFDAGAAGFSSNRFRGHMSRSGKVVPGTFAPVEELSAIASVIGDAGHGVIQAIADGTITPGAEHGGMPELDLLAQLSCTAGRPLTFSTFQVVKGSDVYRRVLLGAADWNARGAQLRPQIIPRSVTFMASLDTYHPFLSRPTYRQLADLPVALRAAKMRQPDIRARILSEADDLKGLRGMLAVARGNGLGRMFPMAAPIDYEPSREQSVKAAATALGKAPIGHFYDLLVEGDCTTFYAMLGSNFAGGTLEPCPAPIPPMDGDNRSRCYRPSWPPTPSRPAKISLPPHGTTRTSPPSASSHGSISPY